MTMTTTRCFERISSQSSWSSRLGTHVLSTSLALSTCTSRIPYHTGQLLLLKPLNNHPAQQALLHRCAAGIHKAGFLHWTNSASMLPRPVLQPSSYLVYKHQMACMHSFQPTSCLSNIRVVLKPTALVDLPPCFTLASAACLYTCAHCRHRTVMR